MGTVITVKGRVDKCTFGLSQQFFYHFYNSCKVRPVHKIQFLQNLSAGNLLLQYRFIGNICHFFIPALDMIHFSFLPKIVFILHILYACLTLSLCLSHHRCNTKLIPMYLCKNFPIHFPHQISAYVQSQSVSLDTVAVAAPIKRVEKVR